MSVNEEGALISSMKISLQSWKWSEKADELLYSWGNILGSIEEPKVIFKKTCNIVQDIIGNCDEHEINYLYLNYLNKCHYKRL